MGELCGEKLDEIEKHASTWVQISAQLSSQPRRVLGATAKASATDSTAQDFALISAMSSGYQEFLRELFAGFIERSDPGDGQHRKPEASFQYDVAESFLTEGI